MPAVEDPVAGRRVGAEHAPLGHGLGVRRVADLDGEAGLLELLLGRVLHHAEDGRGRGVALPAEPPGAHTSARDEQQGEEQEQRTLLGPARPADRGDPGDLARWRHGATVERGGAVHHGGRLGRRCHLGRHPGELVDVEGVRSGVLALGEPDGPQREVAGQLLVLPDPVAQRLGHAVDLVQQHAGVGGSLVEIARGRPRDQRVDVRRQAGHDRRRRRDVLVHVLVGHLDRGLALVRLGAGEQLVEQHPDGVHVGARVAAAVDDELGGEVGDGADEHAAGGGVLGVGGDGLGQAEVGDLDPAVVGDQDVLGLDVAVDQAGPVGVREGREDRLHEGQGARRRHRALLADHVAQRVPGDVLHHEEDDVVVGALVEDGDHVGVVEPRGRAGLADEPGRELLVVAEARVHHLDGAGAVESEVGGLVHAGHPAAGDARADAVAAVHDRPHDGVGQHGAAALAGAPIWLHSTLLRTGRGRIRSAHRTDACGTVSRTPATGVARVTRGP